MSLLLVVLKICVSIMSSASIHATRPHAAPVKFSTVPVKIKLEFGVQNFRKGSHKFLYGLRG